MPSVHGVVSGQIQFLHLLFNSLSLDGGLGPFVGQYVNSVVVLVDDMNLYLAFSLILLCFSSLSTNLIVCVITNLNASFVKALTPPCY